MQYNANAGTKEGIRSPDWFFSIVEKAEVIAIERDKKSEWIRADLFLFNRKEFINYLIKKLAKEALVKNSKILQSIQQINFFMMILILRDLSLSQLTDF